MIICEYFEARDDDAARELLDDGPSALGLEVLDGEDLNPYQISAVLSALSPSEPAFREIEASGLGFVVALEPDLTSALAGATACELRHAANALEDAGEVGELLAWLSNLSELAQRAERHDGSLYCWVSA